MKLGQMISMDAGDILPPEFTQILARLRDQAHHMAPRQLDEVLTAEWGAAWRERLSGFQGTPIAAASIGQVHRGRRADGREVAIKIQYPGIARSIDADVDNVATLLRVTGLLPRDLDIAPLLDEAKRQLHEEADYLREASMMERYGDLVGHNPAYLVPKPISSLTTTRILAMDYVEGGPIEDIVAAPQQTRDAVAKALVQLVLRELFEWGVMQTDPNFANYRWQAASGKLVLLDFGAAREVPATTTQGYRALLMAGIDGDRAAVRKAAVDAGFLGGAAATKHRVVVDDMIDVILAELAKPGPFDFGDRAFFDCATRAGHDLGRRPHHLAPAAHRHAVRTAENQRHRAAGRSLEGPRRCPTDDRRLPLTYCSLLGRPDGASNLISFRQQVGSGRCEPLRRSVPGRYGP